jgi:hypothetical protein
MARKAQVKEGDILAIPFGEDLVAAGIVLHVSKCIRNAMMVGFYDRLFRSADEIDVSALGGPFIATPKYASTRTVPEGVWTVVGHNPELLAAAHIPELRVSTGLYYKDDFIRKLAPEEWSRYPALTVQGDGFVEDRLRDHFTKG